MNPGSPVSRRPPVQARCACFKPLLCLGLCFLALGQLPAQVVPVPGWRRPASQGGPAYGTNWVPKAYRREISPFHIPLRRRSARGKSSRICCSPLSGILYFQHRGETKKKSGGWDTGSDAVFNVSWLEEESQGLSDVYNVALWDQKTRRTHLVRLLVDRKSGTITQRPPGLISPRDELWSIIRKIDGMLVVLELREFKIVRYLDTNGDGQADTLDTNFKILLPRVTPEDPSRDWEVLSAAAELSIIHDFRKTRDGAIRLVTTQFCVGPRTYHEIRRRQDGQYHLVVLRDSDLYHHLIRSAVTAGQYWILVTGMEGRRFHIEAEFPDGHREAISEEAVIPEKRFTLVRVKPLQEGWTILLRSEDENLSPRNVEPARGLVLLSPMTPASFDEGTRVTILGDKLKGAASCLVKWKHGEHRSRIESLTENSFQIVLPVPAKPRKPSRLPGYTPAQLTVLDREGKALGKPVAVKLRHR